MPVTVAFGISYQIYGQMLAAKCIKDHLYKVLRSQHSKYKHEMMSYIGKEFLSKFCLLFGWYMLNVA